MKSFHMVLTTITIFYKRKLSDGNYKNFVWSHTLSISIKRIQTSCCVFSDCRNVFSSVLFILTQSVCFGNINYGIKWWRSPKSKLVEWCFQEFKKKPANVELHKSANIELQKKPQQI